MAKAGWSNPTKESKRGGWSKKEDGWDSFKKGGPKNPSSGPMSEANTRGDQGYDKTASTDTDTTSEKGEYTERKG